MNFVFFCFVYFFFFFNFFLTPNKHLTRLPLIEKLDRRDDFPDDNWKPLTLELKLALLCFFFLPSFYSFCFCRFPSLCLDHGASEAPSGVVYVYDFCTVMQRQLILLLLLLLCCHCCSCLVDFQSPPLSFFLIIITIIVVVVVF